MECNLVSNVPQLSLPHQWVRVFDLHQRKSNSKRLAWWLFGTALI